MPKMYEIYQKYAAQYDELVMAEDYEQNLKRLLYACLDWTDLAVLEAGVGTGRVTKLYLDKVSSAVCSDRSQHMLDYAARSLGKYASKLAFMQAENTALPDLPQGYDVFIEGWSFGHSVVDSAALGETQAVIGKLLFNATKNLKTGGYVFLIETLGTNLEAPIPPHKSLATFYEALERDHHFTRYELRTDYRFENNREAARVMGFFFGEEMERSVLARRSRIIPEWTGVWVKQVVTT